MIRDRRLIDKLIADLHFHNYLFVVEGDNIFTETDENIESLQSIIAAFGLEKSLDAHTDFYHGGNVLTEVKADYINEFIDDVFIDYFFWTYKFKKIIFPKGLCYEQITPEGIIHPQDDLTLDLNNIYDRCTFANNIFRLFGIDNDLADLFPNNKFFKSFSLNRKIYGLHSWCGVLVNDKPIYGIPLDRFISKYYPRKELKRTNKRGKTIKEYFSFMYGECEHEYFSSFSSNYQISLIEIKQGYSQIKDKNIFGEYTIGDILVIYSLLTDKFLLTEDSFLLALCNCVGEEILINEFLNDFILFEDSNLSSTSIEKFIRSKDLYLRFASHTKSKAFTFEPINDTFSQIYLFQKKSQILLKHSNPLPLPYLYNIETNKKA